MLSRNSFLSLSALLCVAYVQAELESCDFEELQGKLLRGSTVQIEGGKFVLKDEDITVEACQHICLETYGCRGFNFKESESGLSKCVFKVFDGALDEDLLRENDASSFYSLPQSAEGHPCHVDLCDYKTLTGVVVNNDHNIKLEGEIEKMSEGETSPSACEAMCKGLEGCRGFEWKPKEQTCKFKKYAQLNSEIKETTSDNHPEDRVYYEREESGKGERCEVKVNFQQYSEKAAASTSASSAATNTFGVFAVLGCILAIVTVGVVVYRRQRAPEVETYHLLYDEL